LRNPNELLPRELLKVTLAPVLVLIGQVMVARFIPPVAAPPQRAKRVAWDYSRREAAIGKSRSKR